MVYRIALIADDHLDYSFGSRTDKRGINLRAIDGYNAFHQRLSSIVSHEPKVDAVFHAGDLFHTPHPSVRSVATVHHYFEVLFKENIAWWGVSGNHDTSDNSANLPATALTNDPRRNIHALWKPYDKVEVADGIILHAIGHHGLNVNEAPEITPVKDSINIMMAHGAAVDPANATLMRCMDSPREQIIPPDLIMSDAFDFRALGHYHSRYAVGGPEMKTWYAGSSLRRGFSDAAGRRGWILVTIEDNGEVTAESFDIEQRPQYDLEIIDASKYKIDEIKELLRGNIHSTRRDETATQFDEKNAPIVRQKIINATGAVRQGLDMQSIKAATGHMLYWDLKFLPPEFNLIKKEEKDDTKSGVDEQGFSTARKGGINIVSGFKEWSETSDKVKYLQKAEREVVTVHATKFLEEAQNKEEELKET